MESLRELDNDVLREVVREAERMLDAQLTTANAADQRAMAWAALITSGAVAILGGSAALLVTGKSLAVAGVGVIVAMIMGFAILKASDVVRPKDWHFPGNMPSNWAPDQWQCYGEGISCDLHQAMLEQASLLDEQIRENVDAARRSGEMLKLSMDLAIFAIAIGVLAVGGLVAIQALGGQSVTLLE